MKLFGIQLFLFSTWVKCSIVILESYLWGGLNTQVKDCQSICKATTLVVDVWYQWRIEVSTIGLVVHFYSLIIIGSVWHYWAGWAFLLVVPGKWRAVLLLNQCRPVRLSILFTSTFGVMVRNFPREIFHSSIIKKGDLKKLLENYAREPYSGWARLT